MTTTIGTATFDPPAAFDWAETTVSFRAPPTAAVQDPRMLQKQAPVARPNLVVNQRTTTDFRTINDVADDVTKKLMATVHDMQDLQVAVFKFSDGKEGVLISYVFPYHKESMLKQFHAVRLDHDTVTTMVLTCGGALPEELEQEYVQALTTMTVG